MFGKVRPSSSSLDSLERPPSKIIKDDSFSIYEATLMKLKLGSKRDLNSHSEAAMDIETNSSSPSFQECLRDAPSSCSEGMRIEATPHISPHEEVLMTDTDCSSANISQSSNDCQSTGSSTQQKSRNLSVLYLFSKYKSLQHARSSSHEEAMTIENDGSFRSTAQSSSEYCHSLSSTKEQSEEECVSSFPYARCKMS